MGTYDILLFFILPYGRMMTIPFATDADREEWLTKMVVPDGMQVDIIKRNPQGNIE